MIDFLNFISFRKYLKPVKVAEYYVRPGEYHPEGLFSEIIFGPEDSPSRKTTFAYIDLNCFVIHPTAYLILKRLNRKIENYVATTSKFSLDSDGYLIDDPEGMTGIEAFMKVFAKIKFRGGDATRDKLIAKIKRAFLEKKLFIDMIPVIPPEYRKCFEDSKGQITCDPINDYYMTIIRKAAQTKQFSKGTEIYDIYNFEMQKAVLEYDKYVKKLLQKKHGLIREYLLSKRVDFSGRGVIVSDPSLKINEVGIPIRMAVSLFEPFIMYYIFNSGKVDKEKLEAEIEKFTNLKLSTDSVKAVLRSIKIGDKIPQTLFDMFFNIVSEVASTRVVILKRDPVLHAEGVRGFNVKIVNSNTIHLSNYHTGGFNADYDGDTMAVYHPITEEAQMQIRERMMRSESGDNYKSVNFEISKEMCTGIFILTKDIMKNNSPVQVTEKDFETATDPYLSVIYRNRKTTMGKAIVNSAFPPDFEFINKTLKKKDINGLIPIILQRYGQKQAIETFSKLGYYGFKFATIGAPSLTLSQFDVPDEVKKIRKQIEKSSPEQADLLIKKAHDVVVEKLKKQNEGLYDLVESGATKGWTQPDQMLIAKGVIADPKGNVLPPISSPFSEGLKNSQYFLAAAGARKGIIDRVLNTAETGYLSRQLAYILNSVEISRNLVDCKTKRTLDIRLSSETANKFNGRYIIDSKGMVVPFRPSEHSSGELVRFRSPIFCESKYLCHRCYGDLMYRHKTPYAGIIAAQIIGEAGTQTIMRTFHTGGAVKLVRQDVIQDTLQNDPYSKKEVVEKLIEQKDNLIYAKQDLKLILALDDYPNSSDVIVLEEENVINAKSLISRIESTNNSGFDFILDYAVNIFFIPEKMYFNDEQKTYEISYQSGEKILEVPIQADLVKEQLRYAQRLLGGKVAFKDVNHLYLKLLKIYGNLRDMDSVHLEVLLSQVLRDRKDESLPARLGRKWDPVMINIKKIVFKTSFIQGLAFENIKEAIETGLISTEPDDRSILEKILTGELVPVEKKTK